MENQNIIYIIQSQLIIKMMRAKMNINEIYQYLEKKNFNLTSDKILKDPAGNCETIWNILYFLAFPIKDTKYEQIQPTLLYLLDSQTHKSSLRRIKEYIVVSDVLKKILKNNEEYPIKQIMKPQRDIMIERMSLLIGANKFYQKIAKQYENQRTQIKLKKQLVQDLKRKLQMRLEEIQEMKSIKQKQKTQYEQKVLSIENLTKQINYKKKQKLDLLNSQQLQDNELKKKIKIANELGYTNDDLSIKIKQLERQVIRNAPKLKKERFALIEQYQNMLKENKDQFQLWNKKITTIQDKLKFCYGVKEKSKTFRIEQVKKQIDHSGQQFAMLQNTLHRDEENKHSTTNNKKELLKNLQQIQKNKKQLIQLTSQEERQLGLLEKSQSLISQDERKHKSNVNLLQQKNAQSINQYKALEDKIRHRRDKHQQKLYELNMRLRDLTHESKEIIEQTFAQFN